MFSLQKNFALVKVKNVGNWLSVPVTLNYSQCKSYTLRPLLIVSTSSPICLPNLRETSKRKFLNE